MVSEKMRQLFARTEIDYILGGVRISVEGVVKNNVFSTILYNLVAPDSGDDMNRFEETFMATTRNEDKLNMLWKDEDKVRVISDFVDGLLEGLTFGSKKSASEASEAKAEGNRVYKKRMFKKALKCYHEAILKAPFPGEEQEEGKNMLASCLANRSAVLYEMNHFKDSIEDIDEAIERGYSQNKLYSLMSRKAKALKALGNREEALRVYGEAKELVAKSLNSEEAEKWTKELEEAMAGEDPKIWSEAASKLKKSSFKEGDNSLVPFASPALKMDFVPEKGRVLRAVEDIEPNVEVINEVAFVSVLFDSFYETRCGHCLNELGHRFVPCSRCTSVKYCSSFCQREAWSSCHEQECDFFDILLLFPLGQSALRVLMRAGTERALQVMDATPVPGNEWLDKVFGHNFVSFWSLSPYTPNSFMKYLTMVSKSIFLSKISQKMVKTTTNVSQERLSLLFLQMILRLNFMTIALEKDQGNFYGSGVFVTNALLSHCCVNNTELNHFGNRMVTTADRQRKIKAGEEVTISYGSLEGGQSYQKRQEYFRTIYGFDCKCKVCLLEATGAQCCQICGSVFKGKGFGKKRAKLCSKACYKLWW